MMSVAATPGAIRRAKLKSNRRHQQTDTELLWAIQTVLKKLKEVVIVVVIVNLYSAFM